MVLNDYPTTPIKKDVDFFFFFLISPCVYRVGWLLVRALLPSGAFSAIATHTPTAHAVLYWLLVCPTHPPACIPGWMIYRSRKLEQIITYTLAPSYHDKSNESARFYFAFFLFHHLPKIGFSLSVVSLQF